LTGWKIEVKSQEEYNKEMDEEELDIEEELEEAEIQSKKESDE
jgi:hypothetical protein